MNHLPLLSPRLSPHLSLVAVVFVYDYVPGAETLQARHLTGGHRARALQEDLLWDYVIQLVAAVRAVHGAGLALHSIGTSKMLVTGSGRLARCEGECHVRWVCLV